MESLSGICDGDITLHLANAQLAVVYFFGFRSKNGDFPLTLRGRPRTSVAFSPSRPRLFAARPTENITRLSTRASAAAETAEPMAMPTSTASHAHRPSCFAQSAQLFKMTVLTACVKSTPHFFHSKKHNGVGCVEVVCVAAEKRHTSVHQPAFAYAQPVVFSHLPLKRRLQAHPCLWSSGLYAQQRRPLLPYPEQRGIPCPLKSRSYRYAPFRFYSV